MTDPVDANGTRDDVQCAINAYDAIRAFNHLTLFAKLPAPVVYDILGNLKGVGNMLPQALGQLSTGLGRSLEEFDVYEDGGGDPAQSVAVAIDHLRRAAELAAELGDELDRAQSAIRDQGYRRPGGV